jgi:hypothetical protein
VSPNHEKRLFKILMPITVISKRPKKGIMTNEKEDLGFYASFCSKDCIGIYKSVLDALASWASWSDVSLITYVGIEVVHASMKICEHHHCVVLQPSVSWSWTAERNDDHG